MTDDLDTPLPASFVALYTEPGRVKPSEPRQAMLQRYGFCEDLANLLVDTARSKRWELQVDEADVLARIRSGLAGGAIDITAPEAGWVCRRLAELLGWEPLA